MLSYSQFITWLSTYCSLNVCSLGRFAGAGLALFANVSFTLVDAAAQSTMRHGLAPAQVAFLRMALTLPVVTVYILFRNPALLRQLDPRPRPVSQNVDSADVDTTTLLYRRPTYTAWLIWLRSLLTSGGLCFLYAGLSRAALSEIITVLSTRAFIIGFLCWLFLREAFGWRLRLASGPNLDIDASTRILGFFFCLASLILDALEMVVMRAIGPGPDPVIMMLAYSATCVFVGPVVLILTGDSIGSITDNLVYAKILLVAGLGLVAQICLVIAKQTQTGGTVAVIAYSQIPMSLLVQSTIIREMPNMLEGLGISLMLVAGIWAIVAETNEREDTKDMMKLAQSDSESDGTKTPSSPGTPVPWGYPENGINLVERGAK